MHKTDIVLMLPFLIQAGYYQDFYQGYERIAWGL